MNTIVFGIISILLLNQKVKAVDSDDINSLLNRLLEVEKTLRQQTKLLQQHDSRIQDLEKECDILRRDNEQLRKQQYDGIDEINLVKKTITEHGAEIARIKNHSFVAGMHDVSQETKLNVQKPYVESDVHLTARSKVYYGEGRRLLLSSTDPHTSIAFYGYMSRAEESPSKHKTLIFDHVITNIGLGYNNNTGVFTMPVDGIYAFSYSVHVYCQEFTMVEIIKNSEVEGVIIADANGGCHHDFSTGNAVLSGSKGDVVYIVVHSTMDTQGLIRSDGYGRSSFSGYLVG